MEIWHLWIIAGIVLFIAEIFTPGFLLACFGVGCFASGLVSFFEMSFKIQILTFSASTVIVFIGIRPLFLKYFYASASKTATNIDALIGKTGLVSERIDPSANKGRVIIAGEDWKGVPIDEIVIESGEKISVVRVEGTKLIVRPVSKEKEG